MRKHNSYTFHLATNLQYDLQIITKNQQDMFQEIITAKNITQNLTFILFLPLKKTKFPSLFS